MCDFCKALDKERTVAAEKDAVAYRRRVDKFMADMLVPKRKGLEDPYTIGYGMGSHWGDAMKYAAGDSRQPIGFNDRGEIVNKAPPAQDVLREPTDPVEPLRHEVREMLKDSIMQHRREARELLSLLRSLPMDMPEDATKAFQMLLQKAAGK